LLPQDMTEAARRAAKAEMIRGFLWFAVGAVITAVTYAAAEPGGRYTLFWGPMAYGGYRLVRAIYYWLNPKALVRSVQ
jgi:hypothetical protein